MSITKKVLVIGGGGREHALSWKLAQSKHVNTVFVSPGNPGTSSETKTVNIQIKATEIEQLIHFAKSESIDLVIIGPEDPLVSGIDLCKNTKSQLQLIKLFLILIQPKSI